MAEDNDGNSIGGLSRISDSQLTDEQKADKPKIIVETANSILAVGLEVIQTFGVCLAIVAVSAQEVKRMRGSEGEVFSVDFLGEAVVCNSTKQNCFDFECSEKFCQIHRTFWILLVVSLGHALAFMIPFFWQLFGFWQPGILRANYSRKTCFGSIAQTLAKSSYLLWFTDITALAIFTILDSNADNSSISFAIIPLCCVVVLEFRSKIYTTWVTVSTHNFFIRSYNRIERTGPGFLKTFGNLITRRRSSGADYKKAGVGNYRDVETVATSVLQRERFTISFLLFWVIQDFFFVAPTTFFSVILLDGKHSFRYVIVHLLLYSLDIYLSKLNDRPSQVENPGTLTHDRATGDQVSTNVDEDDIWRHERQEYKLKIFFQMCMNITKVVFLARIWSNKESLGNFVSFKVELYMYSVILVLNVVRFVIVILNGQEFCGFDYDTAAYVIINMNPYQRYIGTVKELEESFKVFLSIHKKDY
mmetsp:Transcript_14524/g.17610  ORF Transcript_14524/g.17610 Transcript_14524/m.17610 type:complete len:474 (+) Transcript_14524:77-1498(+)